VSRGGDEDTTFDAKAKTKDSEKVRSQGQRPSCRGQVPSRPRTERLKDSRTRLKIRANINVNLVIMISQAFKRKFV